MSKPYIHAQSSAQRYGGKPEDYLAIHNWFDETKAIMADSRHRALRHHSEGIFLCERIFGVTLTNSDGHVVSVRDIGEQHVLEDFGNRFIPSAQDYLQWMPIQDWMINGRGTPPSYVNATQHLPALTPLETLQKAFDQPVGRMLTADSLLVESVGSIMLDGSSLPRKPSHLRD